MELWFPGASLRKVWTPRPMQIILQRSGMCRRFRPHPIHLLRSMLMARWIVGAASWLGTMQRRIFMCLARSSIWVHQGPLSLRVCFEMTDTKASLGGEKMTTLDSLVSDWRSRLVQWLRFSRMILLLLHSWQMDQLFLAALTPMAVTAKTFKISSRTSNSLLPLRWPSAQSLMTEKLLPGVVEMKAATAVQFKDNCLHWCESLLLYWLFYNAIFAAPSHCLNFGSFLQCSFYNAILQFSAASTLMAFYNANLQLNSKISSFLCPKPAVHIHHAWMLPSRISILSMRTLKRTLISDVNLCSSFLQAIPPKFTISTNMWIAMGPSQICGCPFREPRLLISSSSFKWLYNHSYEGLDPWLYQLK